MVSSSVSTAKTNFSDDIYGNLLSVKKPSGTTITYTVDLLRTSDVKSVNGTLVQGFLWADELHPVAELADDFFAGMMDSVSFGGFSYGMGQLGLVNNVDSNNRFYSNGEVTTTVVGGRVKGAVKTAARGCYRVARIVNEKTIREALKTSQMKTVQKQVSIPVVRRYLKMLHAGTTPPPIKVDGGMIVEGNHRSVGGRIAGVEPPDNSRSIGPRSGSKCSTGTTAGSKL